MDNIKNVNSYGNIKNRNNPTKLINLFDYIFHDSETYINSTVVSHKLKLNTLDMLIKYFENFEEYIKCHKLTIIKTQLINSK